MPGSGDESMPESLRVAGGLQIRKQFFPVEFAVKLVHLRNFLAQFREIPFGKAAHDKDVVEFPGFLQFAKLQYHFNALLFGVGNEAAGVDHGNVAMGFFRVVVDDEPLFLKLVEELFGVDEVFGTPHGDDVDRAHDGKV